MIIQPATEKDYDVFHAIYTNPKVMRFLGGVVNKDIIDKQFLKILSDLESQTPSQIFWSIKLSSQSSTIGFVGVVYDRKVPFDCSMGIMLLPKSALKGTAKTAMKLFLDYLFAETNTLRVRSTTAKVNRAACMAAKSVGFKFSPFTPKKGSKSNHYGIINKDSWLKLNESI